MDIGTTSYRAFLLRVWTPGGRSGARASIKDIETSEIRVFGDLDELHEWLDNTTYSGTERESQSQP
ncbi:MAG: hypothetical protein ABFS21_04410 [Actinomycetota bacterium]